ncbi:MAG: hypothetical protein RB296_09925 [Acidobacteriota bacterium]|jgi:hypothetical protein|nr:hypothetical protein [Acidobacteriota bacterium]
MKRVVMLILLLIIVGVFATFAIADEVTIIKNPKPTCVEKEYRQLVKVRELKELEDSEDFLVEPRSLVVDERGHIFAWDAAQAKIFQYDPDLNLVRTFCRRGQGPGEIGGNGPRFVRLFLRGREIYLPDEINRKIICFDTNGDLIKETPMKRRGLQIRSLAVDSQDQVYLFSDNNPGNPHCIDCLDADGGFMRGYLDRSELKVGLYTKFESKVLATKFPRGLKSKISKGIVNLSWYDMVSESHLLFSVIPNDQLLVYLPASGQFRAFGRGKLKVSVRLWPEKALRDYRKKAIKLSELQGAFAPFFLGLIPDYDNPEYFFLNYGNFQNGEKNYLYKFNLSGELTGVFYMSNPKRSFVQVNCKRAHQFYAIDRNQFGNLTIKIYMEENHE